MNVPPQDQMILVNCAACAAPLAHNAPRCVRCKLRYCNATCQHDHWRRGHKQMCKKIHRGGNAEQYNADKKYKEAVAVAVEACADDTKGQTCYICTQALHWKTKEGLVRMCACRGTAGFAHVSCLAEQAKILCAEAEENNLSNKTRVERFSRWETCGLCEQDYHGVVRCALGWACWKTYLGRFEHKQMGLAAMGVLDMGLGAAGRHVERLDVIQAVLSFLRRIGVQENSPSIISQKTNLANCYQDLGRHQELLEMRREIYAAEVSFCGAPGHDEESTYIAALNLSSTLVRAGHYTEATSFLRQQIREATRVLGAENNNTLKLCATLAQVFYTDPRSSPDKLREAVEIMERTVRTTQRVYGGAHPMTRHMQGDLANARMRMEARAVA